MTWEKFFFYLYRVNAMALIVVLCAAGVFIGLELLRNWQYQDELRDELFVSESGQKLPVTGEGIDVGDGEVVAYMEEEGNYERAEGGAVTLANPTNGRSVQVAENASDRVIQFEIFYEEEKTERKAYGWIATIATPEQFERGRIDVVVGTLPGMTRSVAAQEILFVDLPTVRGNGEIGVLLWPEKDTANFVAIRLRDGAIVERASIPLPWLGKETLSQSPRFPNSNIRLSRDAAPRNLSAF